MTMNSDFALLVLVPSILIAADYINGLALFRQLRSEFPSLWKDLDQPEMDAANYASSRLKLAQFVWKGRFLQLNNSKLATRCISAIAIQLALLGCLVYGFASISA